MVVGAIASRTDLAIIGSGPGGYVAALRAADAGLDVTLIDRDALGGTCLNVGCIPSKALIELASLRNHALAADEHGIQFAGGHVDMAKVGAHLGQVSGGLRKGVESLLAAAGVTVRPGIAHFARRDRLSISHDGLVGHLEFDDVIVATGSRPVQLPGLEPDGTQVLDSTGALALTSLPATMAIVGGGYIGIELGTAFAKLGSTVTIVEAAASILPSAAPELRRPVERRLRELGVAVRCGVRADSHQPGQLSLDDGTTVDAAVIVVAVGRRPNSDTCSLEAIGIETDPGGHVIVDDHCRAAPGIYAIGDVTAGPALAHRATADAEAAVAAITAQPHVRATVVPEVIFSDPEIMSVGVAPGAAGCRTHRLAHGAIGRAHSISQTGGATLIVVDEQHTVLGVHAVGPHASELAGEAALAIEMAATLDDITTTMHAHPTMSESIVEAAWLANGTPLHTRR